MHIKGTEYIQCEGIGSVIRIPLTLKTKEEELKKRGRGEYYYFSPLMPIMLFSLLLHQEKNNFFLNKSLPISSLEKTSQAIELQLMARWSNKLRAPPIILWAFFMSQGPRASDAQFLLSSHIFGICRVRILPECPYQNIQQSVLDCISNAMMKVSTSDCCVRRFRNRMPLDQRCNPCPHNCIE